jgi:peptidyl-prolyl cis-trans isomerase C
MTSKTLTTFATLTLAGALLAGCNKTAAPAATATADAAAQKPVATVNGVAISRDVFDLAAKSLASKATADLSDEQKNELLDNLISAEAVSQQAVKDGIDKKNTELAASLAFSRMQLMQQGANEAYLKGKDSTEAELKAEYDKRVSEMPKYLYKAHHILVKTEAEAKTAIARVKKGEKFEAVAKAVSLDTSGKEGGDLGEFPASTMVKPFADAVMALAKGEVTQVPVQTQFGYHVIRLDDKRDNVAPPFDGVKSQIDQLVKFNKFKAYADGLVKAAKVEKSL